MDNIRSITELLFLEVDAFDLLKSIGKWNDNIIDRDKFRELFIRRFHRYSGDQLNSLFDITNDVWFRNAITGTEDKKVFNILTHITQSILVTKGGMPYCKYEEYLRWHEITKFMGEDIFVTNFLAAYDCSLGINDRVDFDWSQFIQSDNKELKYIFDKGMAELHYHLLGSSLIFSTNWLMLMNRPLEINPKHFKEFVNFNDGYSKISTAAYLRSILYEFTLNEQKEDIEFSILDKWLKNKNELENFGDADNVKKVQQKIDFIWNPRLEKTVRPIDYVIANNDNLLMGERQLLYKCFKKANECKKPVFETILYAYLVIKTQFRQAIIQIDNVFGFDNFSYYNKVKNKLLRGTAYSKVLYDMAMKVGVQNTPVCYIEYRISPSTSLCKFSNQLSKSLNDEYDISYGYVVHFLKGSGKILDYKKTSELDKCCRNEWLREKIKVEKDNIINELEKKENKMSLWGIDAAGSEFNARPEVFGSIFRELRHYSLNGLNQKGLPLGITYHVGEDFYDIVDGLRAIDEAIIFLELSNGDRIGHGIALGLDVRHYYEEKYYTVVMPKQVLLDNMAWLLDKVKKYGIVDGAGFMYRVEQIFNRLSYEIYETQIDLQSYIQAWLLRGNNPDCYDSDGKLIPITRDLPESKFLIREQQNIEYDNIIAQKLYYQYHYVTKEASSKSVEWKIDSCHRASFVRILETIQEKMQEEIARRHIAIECNPTSNLRIGNIPRYVEHPIVKFNNEDLIRTDGKVDKSAQISVSINTDDAGIFATSLEKEFTLMALALEKETNDNGEPKYQQRSVYRWLENIRENAFIQKFGEEN